RASGPVGRGRRDEAASGGEETPQARSRGSQAGRRGCRASCERHATEDLARMRQGAQGRGGPRRARLGGLLDDADRGRGGEGGVAGLGGVTVTFARVSGAGALPVPVPTNAAGFWSQSGFEPGTEYRVTLSPEYAFSPGSATFTQAETFNFTAINITCGAFTLV